MKKILITIIAMLQPLLASSTGGLSLREQESNGKIEDCSQGEKNE